MNMMIKRMVAAVAAAFASAAPQVRDERPRRLVGRFRFQDSATVFLGRMPAGMPGDIARHHPVSVEPGLTDSDNPPLFYGIPLLVSSAGDANSLRPYGVADASDSVESTPWGFAVRPYPQQQTSGGMSAGFGADVPPPSGVIDVCRAGYIMANLPAGGSAVKKGDPVYVWCAASAGAEVQSRLSASASAGNTVKLDSKHYSFNGPSDPEGNIEVCVNV